MKKFLLIVFAATLGGPYNITATLPPHDVEIFELNAKPKDIKKVEVIGDKTSIFICTIFDDKAHNLIIVDNGNDYCYMEFEAKQGHYNIQVRNIGNSEDKYNLTSN